MTRYNSAMATAENTELVDAFEQFYRNYYRDEIGELAQKYPNEKRSLYIDWDDLYRYDPDLADDYLSQPEQLQEYAEEALRIYDLPVDVSLGRAHVRMYNLPETTDIRLIRSRHVGQLLSVSGIIRKATDVRPKIEEAAFECQRCGTLNYIPQSSGDFQEPHECQGCERQGPFNVNFDQSEFVDAQKLRVQESPEGLRGGETPQAVDVTIEDDITGEVTPGDHVTVTGVLHLQQQGNQQEKSPIFDVYMDGVTVEIEDEQFEDMDISEEDKAEIIELSQSPDIYEKMIESMAPSIYGYEQEKLSIILQLFSGVTKHLPDGSRIRGDLHMLLIGDPGTGKCVSGDTTVTLADGRERPIKEIVESNLTDPSPVDDGVYDSLDQDVVSLGADGTSELRTATKVWKREAPERMYQIRTESGYELEVTPSHPLFIPGKHGTEAVRAEELEENTFVATPREFTTTTHETLDVSYRASRSNNAVRLELPDEWKPWLSRLIGFIVAEGYVEKREDHSGFVSITNNDREILDDIADALDRLGLNYFERSPHDGKTAREIICSSGEFVDFLVTLEPNLLEGSNSQSVPSDLMRVGEEKKAEFIRAFVDAEGHVSSKEREITVASMSRELLQNVRSMMLSLGITSQLAPRQNGSYRLRISGPQFGQYVNTIGFVTERKTDSAEAYSGMVGNTNRDVVPIDSELLRNTRNTLGLTQSDCGLPRSTYQHYERGSRNPSRESVQSVADRFEKAIPNEGSLGEIATDGGSTAIQQNIQSLRELGENDLLWDQIESINVVEPEYDWVYDLEVEGTHSYLSNNVFSHNSQLLQYVREISPRSVYTSGKGSSAAGLTAAAVRDDFGDGQQWTLEAGAMVLADKGVAAIDELDKMRCVTGDSLVHTPDGIRRIDEIAADAAEEGDIENLENGRTIRDVDLTVWTLTDDEQIVQRPVSAVHEYDAPPELLNVALETGESLTVTPDHPFITLQDGDRTEVPAEALSGEEWVYIPDNIPTAAADGGIAAHKSRMDINTDTGPLTPAHGAVLGYLAGDGNVFCDRAEGVYGIRFTNAEEQLMEDFERSCRSAFDAEPVRHPSEQRNGVMTTRLHGKEHLQTVLDAGMNLDVYDGKRLPEAVTRGSSDTKAAFVRALADSDGSVGERCVKIHSSSYDLLVGVKMLLTEFAITSQIQRRRNEEKRDMYLLVITSDSSLHRYNRRIGFTLDRKQEALKQTCDRTTGDRTIVDVLPDIGDHLESIRDSLRLHVSECGLHDATYCNFENGDANVSFGCAKQILEAFEDRRAAARSDLRRLDDEISWGELQAIKERYHVSQSELATGTAYSQPQISRLWTDDEQLRRTVHERLSSIVESVVTTDLSRFRQLVSGDVKWRRVESISRISGDDTHENTAALRTRLADLVDAAPENTCTVAERLVAQDPVLTTGDNIATALDRFGIPQHRVAEQVGVDQATISRWINNEVPYDSERLRTACDDLIDKRQSELESLITAIQHRQESKVYDLTVDETHNFVSNGMIVHNSEDRSAMHEALEQQSISISKAGINATLKSRCSLLGAANPKYGRFDQYESIGEQIDLEPALISRFDLIFTVTDQPDEEEDSRLAEHILQTNFAGELHTQREELSAPTVTREQVDEQTEEVEPVIDAELLRKYVAHAKSNIYPTMSDEAREAIRDFYVDLRSKGTDEDAPVPVTARKLEALVRLAEASARVRLSDTVEIDDAERVIEIVRSCLQDIGVDPETGQYDADVVETGQSKSQRDRIKNIKQLIADVEEDYEDGAPIDVVLDRADEIGMDQTKAEREIEKLKQKGEVYEPNLDHLRTA